MYGSCMIAYTSKAVISKWKPHIDSKITGFSRISDMIMSYIVSRLFETITSHPIQSDGQEWFSVCNFSMIGW